MTQVLDWQNAAEQRCFVERAVQALRQGQVVAFPTETVYGVAASALRADGVERLRQGKDRPVSKPLTLALAAPEDVRQWVPHISPLGWRLARRCWPGPVTLVFQVQHATDCANALPEEVRQSVCPTGTLGLRVPDHPAALQVLSELSAPAALTSANRSGAPPATRADEVVAALGDDLSLVIDDGPSPYGQASTVVQVNGRRWSILREGVYSAEDLTRCAVCLVLLVCTGNTCRSPLAEGLAKRMLAERLGCTPGELFERGYLVLSAGLAASPGLPATCEAIDVASEVGVDLRGHAGRTLTPDLLDQADHVFAMTQSHLAALDELRGDWGALPRLLAPNGEDIPDPIGQDREAYRRCAEVISGHLQTALADIMLEESGPEN